MKKMFVAAAVVISSIAVMSGVAVSVEEKNPCTEDMAKFCKHVKPNEIPAMVDCLEEHEGKLTPACQAYEAKLEGGRLETKERIRQRVMMRKACKTDVSKFCYDIKGYDETLKCLVGHKNELSNVCSSWIKAVEKEKKK